MKLRVLLATLLSAVLAVMPVFLLGALGRPIREELEFSGWQLGLTVSVFYLTSALASVPAGRLVARLEPRRSLAVSVALSSLALGGMAAVARHWVHVVAFVAIGGIGNAVSQPSSNVILSMTIGHRRQGIAFGIRQAAAPIATTMAGIAVPVIGQTVGWRWAFVSGLGLGAAFVAAMPWRTELRQLRQVSLPGRSGQLDRRLRTVAVAVSLAVASASSMAVFFVEAAVESGWNAGWAGTVLAVCSVAAVCSRVGLGWVVDRTRASLRLVASLMGMGALGLLLLSTAGSSRGAFIAGSLLAFGAGWGWPGVFQLAVVRGSVDPARATGAVMVGMFLGGIYGPAAFGAVAQIWSYPVAWSIAAAALILAAVMLQWTNRDRGTLRSSPVRRRS